MTHHDSPTEQHALLHQEERASAHSRELARISSTLLAALIALLTFLLIVGVQTRVQNFTGGLYTAIVLLGVGLVLFVLGHAAREFNLGIVAKGIRLLQQLVFIGSIVAVVSFVISYGKLVIKPPETQSQPGQPSSSQQGGPPSQQGGAPAPGGAADPSTGGAPPPSQQQAPPQPVPPQQP